VLDKTHVANVVHRDLKPANLFVTARDDGSPRLRVLDFGIAKVVSQGSLARTTSTLGTPIYMSPEQIHGDRNIGPRADLYSVGHIVFTLLVGHAYFERELERAQGVAGLLYRVLQGSIETATQRAAGWGVSLPAAFDAWFARATALEPSERFATGEDLLGTLDVALRGQTEVLQPERPLAADVCAKDSDNSPRFPLTQRLARKRNLILVGLGSITLLTAGFVYRASRQATHAPAASARKATAAEVTTVQSGNDHAPLSLIDAGLAPAVPAPPATANAPASQDTLRSVRRPTPTRPTPNQTRRPPNLETPLDPTDIR